MKKYIVLLLLLTGPFKSLLAQNADFRLLQYINTPVNPGPDGAWRALTNSANYIDVAIPVGVFIDGLIRHDDQAKTKAYTIAVADVINTGATIIIKDIVNRQRPFVTYPGVLTVKVSESGPSFPSGHSSLAFATATSLSIAYPKWYVIAPSYLYASAVGYSRLYLGVHYPTDVLAGAVVGSASAYLTFKARKWLEGKKKTH